VKRGAEPNTDPHDHDVALQEPDVIMLRLITGQIRAVGLAESWWWCWSELEGRTLLISAGN